jgi:hypothetical protein
VLTFSQECDYPSEKYGGCQDTPKTTAVKTVVSEQFDKLTVTLVELPVSWLVSCVDSVAWR